MLLLDYNPVFAICFLFLAHGTSASLPYAAGSKPHILMVLVDDWGWANVGYHRATPTREVVTPNFDRLCSEGVELDQHYVHNVCSPTRSSLLSGRLPYHVNVDNGEPNRYNPKDPVSGYQAIPRNMTVIAQKMKEAGYATHQVGKWDAGMATKEHTPQGRGFNTSFGYFHHDNDYYKDTVGSCPKYGPVTDMWSTDRPAIGQNGTGEYEERLFEDHVLNVIRNHDPSQPLFLYYAPHIVHAPLQVPPEYENKFSFIDDQDRRIYHAMVNFLDDVVGNITEEFQKKGMWNNTLMVVSADNGGPEYRGGGANNYPLKGGKTSNWQGGVRVNAFVSGGMVPEEMRGKKIDQLVHVCDWYATFCHLAGVDPTDHMAAQAKLPPIDSLNMWDLVSGQNMTSPRVDVVLGIQNNENEEMMNGWGLISGDYKILVGRVTNAGWTGPQYPNNTNPAGGITAVENCNEGCLFNIKDDPEERNNLNTTMTEVLSKMQEKLKMYFTTFFNPDRGKTDPRACETAINEYRGFWGPWLP
jgi:arylsulfatase I/J